jgi:hypothetical protein
VGLAPFVLAAANQAAMVALGRPGAGEELLSRHGFADVRRVAVPFVWEFADPDCFARALSSTGPAYEAIQHIGEQVFLEAAADGARVRDGLPLRAEINVVGTRWVCQVGSVPPVMPNTCAFGRRRKCWSRSLCSAKVCESVPTSTVTASAVGGAAAPRMPGAVRRRTGRLS